VGIENCTKTPNGYQDGYQSGGGVVVVVVVVHILLHVQKTA
jgi:hypothetical protein